MAHPAVGHLQRLVGNVLFRARDLSGRYRVGRSLGADEQVTAVLMYHGLERASARLACNPLDVPPEACLAEIEFYRRQGYELTPPGVPARGGASLVVSFDDGLLNTFEHLRAWMRERRIPVLVAICPTVIDEGRIHWWEELLARVSSAPETLSLEIGGRPVSYGARDADRAVADCRSLSRDEVARVMGAVRAQTPGMGRDALLASPYVHEVMGWSHLRELVATGCCIVGAHSLAHDAATRMSTEDLEKDARTCRTRIREELGVDCLDWVYPFGSPADFSAETEAALRRSGFLRTYSTEEQLNHQGDVHLGRFRGDGFQGSLRYYGYVWESRHDPRRRQGGAGPVGTP